jgi:small subunit ribosomal protein S20
MRPGICNKDLRDEAMPHTSSAKKRERQYEKRRLRNRATKRVIKTQIKKFLAVSQAADATPEQLQAEFRLAVKKLDKAAAKRVVHPNLAARKKAQLAKKLQAKTAAAKTPAT